jgi:hypothetical protein
VVAFALVAALLFIHPFRENFPAMMFVLIIYLFRESFFVRCARDSVYLVTALCSCPFAKLHFISSLGH